MMVKLIGKILGALVGSCISPSWFLMNLALKDYINLTHAMQGPRAMLMEVIRFQDVVLLQPEVVLFKICPILIGILILSSLCISLCSHVGGQAMVYMVNRSFRTTSPNRA
jgi:hypothetical protein